MESSLNKKVLQVLNEFESMGNIQPSVDWNQSLMNRIASSRVHKSPMSSITKYAVIVLCIVLVNIGFILNSMINNQQKAQHRNNELQVISKE